MRTAIILGALFIASAINREVVNDIVDDFYLTIIICMMIMDVVDFITSKTRE